MPLIIKFPNNIQPTIKESDALVSLVDILPTLLEINGMTSSQKMDGQSLMPLIQGKTLDRKAIFVQYDGNGSLGSSQRCVLKGNYKLIVDMFKDEAYVELYDVVKDPQETENLLFDKKYEATADELIVLLRGYMKTSGDRLTLPKDLRTDFLKGYKNGAEKGGKSE